MCFCATDSELKAYDSYFNAKCKAFLCNFSVDWNINSLYCSKVSATHSVKFFVQNKNCASLGLKFFAEIYVHTGI